MTVYALDPSGSASANKVLNEVIDTGVARLSVYGYIELGAGLFYKDGITASFTTPEGVVYPLTYGVHYWPCFKLVGATAENASNTVWGGLVLRNPSAIGTLTVSYQAFGGKFVLNKRAIDDYVASHSFSEQVAFLELVLDHPILVGEGEPPFTLQSFSEIDRLISARDMCLLSVAVRPYGVLPLEVPVVPVGLDGAPGKSAYELAVADGFSGTVAEWLASLNGSNGVAGADGVQGAVGNSAYQIAVLNGYVGSEANWLLSLKGAQGPQGNQGIQGAAGTNGTNGANGANGAQGATGATGAQGPQGIQGVQGTAGSDANITAASIAAALNYTPADANDIGNINAALAAILG